MANGYSTPGYYNTATPTRTTRTVRSGYVPPASGGNRFGEFTIDPRASNPRTDQPVNPQAIEDFRARRAVRGTLEPYFQAGAFVGPGGRTALDNILAGMGPAIPAAPGGGGGSRGGGGGGGGTPGVDQATKDAYLAMLNNLRGSNPIDDAWAAYEASMRAAYDPAAAAQKWDTAGGQIGQAGQQGRDRLGGIYDQMVARAATGRQAVADAVRGGDQALQAIAQRFGAASQGGADNINNVLSNFDAGRMDPGVFQNELNSLFAAGQVGNQRMGTAFDVAFADRPQMYAALNSDVASGMTAQEQAMMNQIAAKKAAEQQALSAQLQQVLGQAGISRAQAQVERQAQIDKLMADLAGMGIQA